MNDNVVLFGDKKIVKVDENRYRIDGFEFSYDPYGTAARYYLSDRYHKNVNGDLLVAALEITNKGKQMVVKKFNNSSISGEILLKRSTKYLPENDLRIYSGEVYQMLIEDSELYILKYRFSAPRTKK